MNGSRLSEETGAGEVRSEETGTAPNAINLDSCGLCFQAISEF